MENHQQGRLIERSITNAKIASAGTGRSIRQAMKLGNITQPTNSITRPLTIYRERDSAGRRPPAAKPSRSGNSTTKA